MSFPFVPDVHQAIDASTRLIGLAIAVTSLERACGSRYYRSGEILAWDVVRHRFPNLEKRAYAGILERAFGFPGFPLLLGVRGIVGLVLVITGAGSAVTAPALSFVFFAGLLGTWRNHDLGHSAMDRAILLVAGALCLASLAPRSELAAGAAATFIAVNAALCYFKSAIFKFRDPEWRRGWKALEIVDTSYLGRRTVAGFFRAHPALTRAATWQVLGVELAFPLALLGGATTAWCFVVWGLVFHAANWVILGLRGFVWTFAACYPPIIWLAAAIAATGTG